jgi:hypothetical protein
MKSVATRLIPLAVLALASCASNPAEEPQASPWLAPSPVLERQIEERVARLPWSHGQERVDLILWFASVGEPTYSYLLELCSDPRPDVSAAALAALGATRDSRLVDHLRALDWPEVLPEQVRFERARAFLRLGDWSEVGVLVDGLADDELWTRAWCFRALQESTNRTFDFDPKASEEERRAGVERWRDWVTSRELEGILITQ